MGRYIQSMDANNIDDVSDGVANAFSMLMYDETKRHVSKTPMLVVPAIDPE